MQTLLNTNHVAQGAIAAFRIVKPGTADRTLVQAAASTDALIGVMESVAPAAGERCDAVRVGVARLEYGGTVAAGDPITADANGRGIKAAPAAGSNVRIVGFAEVAAVSGDIADVLLAPGVMQG